MDINNHEVHQRLEFGAALAAMAGGLDAYTYLLHGEVFAGLQTGNFILLGIHLGQGNWNLLLSYIIPIVAFFSGVLIARYLQNKIINDQQLWFLGFETALLLFVGLLAPYFPDLLSNALLSIAAAMQLQAFTKLKGKPFTSLMMTGNLRSLATNFFEGYVEHNSAKKTAFIDTLCILSCFAFGALLNGFLITYFDQHTILFSLIFLGIAIFLLVKDKQIFL